MNTIILGDKSDIAQGLKPMLEADGWTVYGWNRNYMDFPTVFNSPRWELIISAIGRVSPVGHWSDVRGDDFDACIESNVLLPIRLLRIIWPNRNPNASICFLAGSNPNKPMAGYSAYNAGKMALLKVCEQLDFETPDAKFFALGPGYVPTKIHKATLDAGWKNERIERGGGTPIEKIYDCLKWCIAQPKEVVGGRNICVSDPYGPELAERLKSDLSMYKLRRAEPRKPHYLDSPRGVGIA